ncbi:MAG: DUF4394 domain-containing protein [Coxiellaceae bacterium]|nr:DUF4394 domain-containing protein [Coxiellaceae bacterium]
MRRSVNKMNSLLLAIAICLPLTGYCANIFTVSSTTGTTNISLAQGASTTETFTVTNTSGTSFSGLSFFANYYSPSIVTTSLSSDSSNTCRTTTTLANGASCVLEVNINASTGLTGSVSNGLTPRVCMFNGAVCSGLAVPISLSVYSAPPAATGTLYGVTGSGSDEPETLFSLNPSTALATLVMVLSGGDDGEAIASDGVNLYHWSGYDNPVFQRINLAQLTTTDITLTQGTPPTDVYFEVQGVVYNGNTFLATSYEQQFIANTIAGVQTLVNNVEYVGYRGMACLHHTIYAVDTTSDTLYTINQTTGAATAVATISMSGYTITGATGLTVNPTSQQFYVLLKVSGSQVRKLAKLNIATGVATLVGDATDASNTLKFASIAFHPADPSCS